MSLVHGYARVALCFAGWSGALASPTASLAVARVVGLLVAVQRIG